MHSRHSVVLTFYSKNVSRINPLPAKTMWTCTHPCAYALIPTVVHAHLRTYTVEMDKLKAFLSFTSSNWNGYDILYADFVAEINLYIELSIDPQKTFTLMFDFSYHSFGNWLKYPVMGSLFNNRCYSIILLGSITWGRSCLPSCSSLLCLLNSLRSTSESKFRNTKVQIREDIFTCWLSVHKFGWVA